MSNERGARNPSAVSLRVPGQMCIRDSAEAMASSFGLVEKVDFDSLTFETDDE